MKRVGNYGLFCFAIPGLMLGSGGCTSQNPVQPADGSEINDAEYLVPGASYDTSPTGNHVVYSSSAPGRGLYDKDLFLLDLRSKRVSRLTNTNDVEITPAFSPDGQTIAYASISKKTQQSHIFLYDLKHRSVRQVTAANSHDTMPSFSHDGTHITFVRAFARDKDEQLYGAPTGWHWGDWGVCVMGKSGAKLKRITPGGEYFQIESPRFTRPGNAVIYAANIGELKVHFILIKVFLDGKRKSQILTPPQKHKVKFLNSDIARSLDISPDGTKLAFLSDRRFQHGRRDLCLMNANGTGTLILLSEKEEESFEHPDFSPDGKALYFLRTRYQVDNSDNNRSVSSLWKVDIKGRRQSLIASVTLQ